MSLVHTPVFLRGVFKRQAPLTSAKESSWSSLSEKAVGVACERMRYKALIYSQRKSVQRKIRSQPFAIDEALNFSSHLTMTEKGINLVVSLGICSILLLLTKKPSKEMFLVPYLAFIVLLGSSIAFIVYAMQLYRKYSLLKRSELELQSKNSAWINMHQEDGSAVKLHCRVECPRVDPSGISYGIHCVHGFGSHSFSFSFVQRRLAHALSSLVSSHDICGFGLSQRPSGYIPYTMKFHGHASIHILDTLLKDMSGEKSFRHGQKVKKILIGHSLGCSAVAEALIENKDDNVAGAILIAPAILSYGRKTSFGSVGETKVPEKAKVLRMVDGLLENEDSRSDLDWDQVGMVCYKIFLTIQTIFLALVTEFFTGVLFLVSPLLKVLLGVAVFPRKFWEFGLTNAIKSKESIDNWDRYIDNYRIPVLVKGWEEGLLRFVLARISRKKGILHALRQIWHSKDSFPQIHRLAERNTVPILIVHGQQDVIVPLINSRRLVEYIPNAELSIFDCGHMPHEEMPSEFLEIAERFIRSL